MNEAELKKLKRLELLEIMYELRKEYDALRDENEELRKKADRADRLEQMIAALYDDRFGKGSAEKLLAPSEEPTPSEAADE